MGRQTIDTTGLAVLVPTNQTLGYSVTERIIAKTDEDSPRYVGALYSLSSRLRKLAHSLARTRRRPR